MDLEERSRMASAGVWAADVAVAAVEGAAAAAALATLDFSRRGGVTTDARMRLPLRWRNSTLVCSSRSGWW